MDITEIVKRNDAGNAEQAKALREEFERSVWAFLVAGGDSKLDFEVPDLDNLFDQTGHAAEKISALDVVSIEALRAQAAVAWWFGHTDDDPNTGVAVMAEAFCSDFVRRVLMHKASLRDFNSKEPKMRCLAARTLRQHGVPAGVLREMAAPHSV